MRKKERPSQTMPAQERNQVKSVPEFAGIAGISERTAWRIIKDREIVHVKNGGRTGVTLGDIVDYIESLKVQAFDPSTVDALLREAV